MQSPGFNALADPFYMPDSSINPHCVCIVLVVELPCLLSIVAETRTIFDYTVGCNVRKSRQKGQLFYVILF